MPRERKSRQPASRSMDPYMNTFPAHAEPSDTRAQDPYASTTSTSRPDPYDYPSYAEPSYSTYPSSHGSTQSSYQGYGPAQPSYQGYGPAQPSYQGYGPAQPSYQGYGSAQPSYQGYASSQPSHHRSSQPSHYRSSQPSHHRSSQPSSHDDDFLQDHYTQDKPPPRYAPSSEAAMAEMNPSLAPASWFEEHSQRDPPSFDEHQFNTLDQMDGKKPYRCTQYYPCKASFHSKTALNQHIRTHTGEKPLYCDICFEPFATSSHRKDHMKSAHSKEQVQENRDLNAAIETRFHIGQVTGFQKSHNFLKVTVKDDSDGKQYTTSTLPKNRLQGINVGSLVSFKIHWVNRHKDYYAHNIELL